MYVQIYYPNGQEEYTHISDYRKRTAIRDPSLRRAKVKLDGKDFWKEEV